MRWAGRAMLCAWMETKYLRRCYGQVLEVNEDVADRNQDGLMGFRKTQGNWVVEFCWCMSRIEGVGDIFLRRARPTQGCSVDDDDLKQANHYFHELVCCHLLAMCRIYTGCFTVLQLGLYRHIQYRHDGNLGVTHSLIQDYRI